MHRPRQLSTTTATSGRTGTTPHAPPWRPSARKGEDCGLLQTRHLHRLLLARPDRLVGVRRYDVEETYDLREIVAIDDSELMRFARVVRYEGDAFTGCIYLEELHGEEAEQAAMDLELSYEEWCEPLEGQGVRAVDRRGRHVGELRSANMGVCP